MRFTDRFVIDGGIKRTKEGYAIVTPRVARGGNVQTYLGSELGVSDRSTLRVYRPDSEVFHKDSLKSYSGAPVTNDHPPEMVDAKNWKDHSAGEAGDEILRDGEFIRVPMTMRDATLVSAMDAGKVELSPGYDANIVMVDGVSPKGEAYDAIMSNIRVNHIAVVDRARGGQQLRIGDGANWGAQPVTDHKGEPSMPGENTPALRTILMDGISILVTDQGAQAIDKLQKQVTDANTAKAQVDTKVAELTTSIATKDAEIATLKKQVEDGKVTPQKLRDAAKSYARTVEIAKKLAPALTISDSMDELAIMKGVVAAKLGDAAKDWNEAQIAASFATFAGQVKDALVSDPMRSAIASHVPVGDAAADADKAHGEYTKNLTDAWRGPQANKAA
jgi:hypothetical protein